MDAPKHKDCKVKPDAQYYRVAGKNLYKCQSCKEVKSALEFKKDDFLWRKVIK